MFLAEANPLNASELIFPTLECIHIAGFAILVGTIAIVDFRLLGVGMRQQTSAELARDLGPWTLFGLVLMLFSGPLMFSSDPDMYYLNRSFQIKMALLLVAIIFNYTIHRRVALKGASPPKSKLVACVSMLLWVGVIFGGIFIAFI
ncbi:MAG: hypothetical protein C5B51_31590 [Terriglobia bacterium]|nr:MAG: hypothetical protein C5B51_31590 [Terriglobia bacterium]